MSNAVWSTRAMLVGVVLLIGLWDIVIIQVGGKDASVSNVAIQWAKENPVITLVLGVVLGHIFWPN